ncbi:hypothetical protein DQ04_00961040 [Trypanosoma grayi]|uniref:hypothetical protein n=1 Tax=Trypanosoma grayi TaxID=71804 RepID=UPI0004F455A7|nr:hypothetical protein DQ04_00961040 [Trypanosoma grayi]KEG13511.1 hypothetical protein DQ04_00961040 [Trypanosoma grayi]
MAAAASRTYLQERVQRHYLEVLPSRWRAVLSRLAMNTQAWQRRDATPGGSALADIHADFDLVSTLLEEEHNVYREGMDHLGCELTDGEAGGSQTSALRRLLHGMLACIALKEVTIAHWKNSLLSIPPDTLRVYCHACIAHPHVCADDVKRVLATYSAP